MSCLTVDRLHPYASTIVLDGVDDDREAIQDIAYDGDVALKRPNHAKQKPRLRELPRTHLPR